MSAVDRSDAPAAASNQATTSSAERASSAAAASSNGAGEAQRTRTFSWSDPSATAAEGLRMSGLDYLRAIAAGELPAPPFGRTFDVSLVEVDEGRALFAAQPAEWMYNPLGAVHGGVAAALLDSCMGCAVHSTLEAGVGYTTTDLQVRYVRSMSVETGRVLAEGRVVHRGARLATAEGRLTAAADGRLIAHATTGCAILR